MRTLRATFTPQSPVHHYATGQLHRAIVSLPGSMCPRHDPLHERIVFFDCPRESHAGTHLEKLLALAWNTDTTGWLTKGFIYNIYSARELLDIGSSSERDQRLLEIGWGGPQRIYYASSADVDLLVPPRLYLKLCALLNQVREAQ